VEANSTGDQGSRRAVAPTDDDDNDDSLRIIIFVWNRKLLVSIKCNAMYVVLCMLFTLLK
jgi:hypothetical protein